MDFILANFLRDHEHHDVWWYRLKITPKVPSNSANDALSLINECPGEYALSKLLGITMQDLWEVLIACNCAKTFGKRGSAVVDKDALKNFITLHGLDHVVVLDEKKKQPVLHIGIYSPTTTTHVDHSATLLWKAGIKTAASSPPCRQELSQRLECN
jgi:hypothetical protein